MKEPLKELELLIEYTFKNKDLLEQALTHTSYAFETKKTHIDSYERLEFLGDAVLELISSKFLYAKYDRLPEGELTKLRASLVCEQALAFCANKLGINRFILLSKGEDQTGGRNRDSIVSDVLEAIIGAIYLDSGFDKAENFVLKYVLANVDKKVLFHDAKTILQEKIQGIYSKDKHITSDEVPPASLIKYTTIKEEGPDHNKSYTVEVSINGRLYGTGIGKTKKSAEQNAAYEALNKL